MRLRITTKDPTGVAYSIERFDNVLEGITHLLTLLMYIKKSGNIVSIDWIKD